MALRIMVVDDEAKVTETIKAMVKTFGCEVVTLTDSREAAKCLDIEKFDGIFVDWRMPHLDGFELTQSVRASRLNAKVPVVLLTGYDDVHTMRKGFRAGITFFLGKPFTQDRIQRLLRALHGSILKEKRLYPRLPFRTTVNWESRTRRGRAVSVNISEGGMLVEMAEGLAVGEPLDLEFSLSPAPQRLQARACAVHSDSVGRVGKQFTQIDIVDREAIRRYILGLLLI